MGSPLPPTGTPCASSTSTSSTWWIVWRDKHSPLPRRIRTGESETASPGIRSYIVRSASSPSILCTVVVSLAPAWGRPRGDGRQGKEGQRGGGDVPDPVYRGGGQIRCYSGRAAGQQRSAPRGSRG